MFILNDIPSPHCLLLIPMAWKNHEKNMGLEHSSFPSLSKKGHTSKREALSYWGVPFATQPLTVSIPDPHNNRRDLGRPTLLNTINKVHCTHKKKKRKKNTVLQEYGNNRSSKIVLQVNGKTKLLRLTSMSFQLKCQYFFLLYNIWEGLPFWIESSGTLLLKYLEWLEVWMSLLEF